MIVALVPAAVAVFLLVLASRVRSAEGRQRHATTTRLTEARERGSDRARLQHPHIDLSRCLGCGLCVDACPEEGVLELVLGQARVVHGARCVGHGRCAAECPVDAIAITLGDVSARTDLPALGDDLEAVGAPGVFLAGEVTGHALVRTAVAQGVGVGREVARRSALLNGQRSPAAHDLVVVGAGPAGLACALAARAAGLDFVVVEEQRHVGGTVAAYPRQKLVMTQPMELPLHGMLRDATYTKEDLVELWERLTATHEIPLRLGGRLERVTRDGDALVVQTSAGELRTRNVCLALGRRGVPRKLGVPGEDLPKVAYSLLDARAYAGRAILVVGGGDSAVEAALGLAAQSGTRVTIAYRKAEFFRLKAANETRIRAALEDGRLSAAFSTEVELIEEDRVILREGQCATLSLANDHVFVFAGGEPPFALLERCGVSFDPSLRTRVELPGERGTGLAPALAGAALIALAVTGWVFTYRHYYGLDPGARVMSPEHGWLRPARGAGFVAGVTAVVLVALNLLYLVRRHPRLRLTLGSLRHWMTVHVATGVTALMLAALHGGLQPRVTSGGFALAALGLLVTTGAIGRYLYAFVPRAASGRELALEEVQTRLASFEGEWEGDHPAFRDRVRTRVAELVSATHWSRGLAARVASVVTSGRRLRRALRELRAEGAREEVPEERVEALLVLARRSHRVALAATWYDELRGLMASWRYLHRWVALGMVLLVAVHVWAALRYGRVGWEAAP